MTTLVTTTALATLTVLIFIYGAVQRTRHYHYLKKIELERIKSENRIADSEEIHSRLVSKIESLREESREKSAERDQLLTEIKALKSSLETEKFETAVTAAVEQRLKEQTETIARFVCVKGAITYKSYSSARDACFDFWESNPGKTLYIYEKEAIVWSGMSGKSLNAFISMYEDRIWLENLYIRVVTSPK